MKKRKRAKTPRSKMQPIVPCDGSGWIDVGDPQRNERCVGCNACESVCASFRSPPGQCSLRDPCDHCKRINERSRASECCHGTRDCIGKGDKHLCMSEAHAQELRDIMKRGEEKPWYGRNKERVEEPTGVCRVCGGEVVAKVTEEYHGDPMHRIIGPGARHQMRTVHHGWHCAGCGLKYEFVPTSPAEWPYPWG